MAFMASVSQIRCALQFTRLKDHSPQMASLYTLPEEVLLKIFSYLQPQDLMFGVRRSCHYFHDLSLEPSLWTHVTITNFAPRVYFCVNAEMAVSNVVSEKFYKKLLQQKCIRRGVSGCEVSGPKKKRQTGKGLDTVPIKNVITSIEERGKIWSSCSVSCIPHLQRLTLVRYHMPSMEFLAKYSALQLLDLKVEASLNTSPEIVIGLFESLKCLTNLQILKLVCLSDCIQVTQRIQVTEQVTITKSMVKYFSMGPCLRQIELSYVNGELLKAILDHCLQLENLALANLKLTPEDFTAVSKDPRQLFSLRMEHCQNLNDDCLKCMALIFPNLKSLHLSLTEMMTDDGVGCLLGACPQLTSLKLTLPHVHGRAYSAVRRAAIRGNCLKELHRSGNLQCLVLENFTQIHQPVFRDLCQHQQNLRTIELRRCAVDNSDLMALAGSCRLLQTVTVRDCPAVDSAGVNFLMTNLPRLQTLNCQLHHPHVLKLEKLQPSRKITRSGGLVLLDQPMTWLRSLELAVCQELTDANVSALASLCPAYLRSLHLRAANFVNDHAVSKVLRSFPQLQDLRLASLSKVANEENQLTSECLRHIHQWGQGLQSLQLVAFFRSFTIDDLARHIASSSSLVSCCVPMCTNDNECRRSEIIKDIQEKVGQMTDGKKRAVAWEAYCDEDKRRLDVSRHLLCIRIYHWPRIA